MMRRWIIVHNVRPLRWSCRQCRGSAAERMAHIRRMCLPSWTACSVCHADHVWGLGSWSLMTTNLLSRFWGSWGWHICISGGNTPSFNTGIFALYFSGNCLGALKVCWQHPLKVLGTWCLTIQYNKTIKLYPYWRIYAPAYKTSIVIGLIARNVCKLFSSNRGISDFYAACCINELSRGSILGY